MTSPILAWFDAKVSAAADYAFREYTRTGGSPRLYLWFRRGDLVVSHDAPPGLEAASPEHLPCNLTLDQLRAWIRDRARVVPCLPE